MILCILRPYFFFIFFAENDFFKPTHPTKVRKIPHFFFFETFPYSISKFLFHTVCYVICLSIQKVPIPQNVIELVPNWYYSIHMCHFRFRLLPPLPYTIFTKNVREIILLLLKLNITHKFKSCNAFNLFYTTSSDNQQALFLLTTFYLSG